MAHYLTTNPSIKIENDIDLNSILNKVECDNDCPTDSNQITLAIKYLESQLLQAIELNKKSIN